MTDARHAPATMRNRQPLAEVFRRVLPAKARVLEVASGTGEHAVYFASELDVIWQPSDADPDALRSIEAHRLASTDPDVSGGVRCRPPIAIDASAVPWAIEADAVDAIVCINMIHISPWEASAGLFQNAGALLSPGAPLLTYGPYRVNGEQTSASNVKFEGWLHSLDPGFGVRDIDDLRTVATAAGLVLDARVPMPANNFTLVWRKE